MELFTKHCAICGKRIERGNDIKRFGKHFDSEEHAEQYAKMTERKTNRLLKSTTTQVAVAAKDFTE